MASVANDEDSVAPLVPEGDSLVYEEELLRNPYSTKLWLRYLEVFIHSFITMTDLDFTLICITKLVDKSESPFTFICLK
jgi:hypothetical protein